jgi:hypothetical protein
MVAGVVSACVRSARRRRRLLSAGEVAVIALSVGIGTLAAAAVGGTPATDRQAQLLALAVAILAGIAWGIERRADARSIARAMDRSFGLSGAWLTAFEIESRGSASPVAALLAREIAPAVSLNRFTAEAARSSALLLAVPFVSLSLWTLATEAREAPALVVIAPGDGGGVSSEAARLAETPGLPAHLVEKLRALAVEAGALRSPDRSRATPEPERAAAQRELAGRLDALRREVESSGMTRAGREGTMEGPDARIEPPPAASMHPTSTPDTAVPPSSGANPPGEAGAVPAEKGVLSPRWWPARYDAVVERWLQSEQAARDGRPR